MASSAHRADGSLASQLQKGHDSMHPVKSPFGSELWRGGDQARGTIGQKQRGFFFV